MREQERGRMREQERGRMREQERGRMREQERGRVREQERGRMREQEKGEWESKRRENERAREREAYHDLIGRMKQREIKDKWENDEKGKRKRKTYWRGKRKNGEEECWTGAKGNDIATKKGSERERRKKERKRGREKRKKGREREEHLTGKKEWKFLQFFPEKFLKRNAISHLPPFFHLLLAARTITGMPHDSTTWHEGNTGWAAQERVFPTRVPEFESHGAWWKVVTEMITQGKKEKKILNHSLVFFNEKEKNIPCGINLRRERERGREERGRKRESERKRERTRERKSESKSDDEKALRSFSSNPRRTGNQRRPKSGPVSSSSLSQKEKRLELMRILLTYTTNDGILRLFRGNHRHPL